MTYVQPHLITAHAPLISAPGVQRQREAPAEDYKVTGTSIFDRPDDDSQWDPGNGGRWIRKWQPGEKEAEALGRVGEVKNRQEKDMLDYRHQLGIRSGVVDTMLRNLPRLGPASPGMTPAIPSRFPSAPEAAPTPQKGSVTITPSIEKSGDMSALYNKVKDAFPKVLEMWDCIGDEKSKEQFGKAIAVALETLSNGGASAALTEGGGGDTVSSLVSAFRNGGAAPSAPTGPAANDEIGDLYGNGQWLYGNGESVGSRALSYLNPPNMDEAIGGGESLVARDYGDSLAGILEPFINV